MSIQIAYDCIHANIGRAPAGLLAGYTTGSSDTKWTDADWAAHPGAVRIDQDPAASDSTADVLDVENGAATLTDIVPWSKRALAAHRAGTRPGQRSPVIYASASNLTPIANTLTGAKMDDGSVGLFVANWNLNQSQAVAGVAAASGPFPVHGIQFTDAGNYDIDIFSAAWLNAMSQAPDAPQASPTNSATPAPTGLSQSVRATGWAVTCTWNEVKGETSYHFQLESYKKGFGWVIGLDERVSDPANTVAVAPATQYRWRVAAGESGYTWPAWQEFTTS